MGIAGAILIPIAKVFGNRRRKDMAGQTQQYLQANNLPADTPCYLLYKGMSTDGYVATTANALYMFPKNGQSYTVPYNTITSFTISDRLGRLPTLVLRLTSGQPLSFAVHDLSLEFSEDLSNTIQSAESFASFLMSHGVTSPQSPASPPPTPTPPVAPQTPPAVPQPVAVSNPAQPYPQAPPTTPPVEPPSATPQG